MQKRLPVNWLGFLLVIITVLGIFFRFVNLDRKVYWHDETLTSLTISGYTWTEMKQVFDGNEIGVADLQKYQRTNPEKGIIDSIKSLAEDFPEHPPIYYAIARLWVQWFGNSVAVTRSVSAAISLLAFPCIYWLCLELFESPLVGWMAIALIAISPFHVLYAQEAREYSLWTVTVLLSSAVLLYAERRNCTSLHGVRVWAWVIYAITVALGLYTYPVFGLVVIAHGIYILANENFRFSKTLVAFVLASLAGFLVFAPWLWAIITNPGKLPVTKWTAERMAFLSLIQTWVGNYSRIFIDFNLDSKTPIIYNIIPILIAVSAIAYSLYFLCCQAPKRVWLFVALSIAVPALFFMVPDLILGGRRSSISRYMIPSYLGIHLAVAYLLATKISAATSRQRLWQVISLVLISSGIASCAVSSNAEAWWNKKNSHNNPQTARIINKAANPLLIASDRNINPGELLSLSHMLDRKVRLQLVVEPNIPKISNGFSDVFLFNPSKTLRNKLEKEQNYKIELVNPREVRLWRIANR